MRISIISQRAIRRHLTYERCLPVLREAMIALSAGRTRQTLRQIVPIADRGMFGVMQGALPAGSAFGAKVLSVFPGNVAAGGQSHQGLVLLFDPMSGCPTSLVHAGELTAIRTAAASAVATDVLAQADAHDLAILGTGEQARRHAEALVNVRALSRITIWGRSLAKAESLASALEAELGCTTRAVADVESAVAEADIICTTTAAAEPILEGRHVRAGAHLNVVGSSYAGPAEIDEALVLRARIFADHREAVLSQGAEFLRAKAAGLVDDAHVLGELGEVLAGGLAGRTSPSDITLYKSLGHIVQDLASAALVAELIQGTEDDVAVDL